MSSPKQSPHKSSSSKRSPPAIRIQSASPDLPLDQRPSSSPPETEEPTKLAPRRTRSLPVRSEHHHQHRKKRSAKTAQLATQPEIPIDPAMSSRSSRSSSDSSHKHTKSSKKSKAAATKDEDWSEVADPEERRRIQNRIAQRKFREKARETRESAERDSRNQEYAGNSYRIPNPSDFSADSEPSGLPWGGVNMQHFITRGHETQSRRSSSRRDTYVGDDSFTYGGNPYTAAQYSQTPSSGGGEEVYYDDPYLYDPNSQHGQ